MQFLVKNCIKFTRKQYVSGQTEKIKRLAHVGYTASVIFPCEDLTGFRNLQHDELQEDGSCWSTESSVHSVSGYKQLVLKRTRTEFHCLNKKYHVLVMYVI